MENELDDILLNKKSKISSTQNLLNVIEILDTVDVQRICDLINPLESIQPTSLNCKRVFSLAGWVNSKVRNRIAPELLDFIIFIKANFRKYAKYL